ncbi:MAG: hypothetical protein ABI317_03925, partial [Gaiellales bacterium]
MTSRRTLVAATATPLASIFGSGFLIIVPVLESAFGRRAVFAVALVCAVAFLAGIAVRHNVRYLEDALAARSESSPFACARRPRRRSRW